MNVRPTRARGDPTTLLRDQHYPGHAQPTLCASTQGSLRRPAAPASARHVLAVALLLVAVVGALALTGCSRETPPQTAGERLDTAIDKTQARLGEAQRSAEDAAKAAGTAITDTAITGAVKTQLAADADLKMLDISVETRSGRTVLQGKVPSAEARARATRIAAAVTGVSAVDNQLDIRP